MVSPFCTQGSCDKIGANMMCWTQDRVLGSSTARKSNIKIQSVLAHWPYNSANTQFCLARPSLCTWVQLCLNCAVSRMQIWLDYILLLHSVLSFANELIRNTHVSPALLFIQSAGLYLTWVVRLLCDVKISKVLSCTRLLWMLLIRKREVCHGHIELECSLETHRFAPSDTLTCLNHINKTNLWRALSLFMV
jgi:hypothetical protein